MVMRFSELKQKEVINCKDCRKLGFVTDLEIDDCNGKILKIIVPGPGRFCGCIGRVSEYCIPYNRIIRIGSDIILVDIVLEEILVKCKE